MTDQATAEGGAAPCGAAVAHRVLVVGWCGHGRGGVRSGLCAGKQPSGSPLDGDAGCGCAFVRRWSGGVAVRLSRQKCAEAGASAARRSGAYHPARTGAGIRQTAERVPAYPLDAIAGKTDRASCIGRRVARENGGVDWSFSRKRDMGIRL